MFKLEEQHKKVEGQLVVFFNMNHEKVCIYLKKKKGGGREVEGQRHPLSLVFTVVIILPVYCA